MALSIQTPTWKVTDEKVDQAVHRIVEFSRPAAVILFGSYVWGETTANSDLDVLVITSDDIDSPRRESVRIRRALRGIHMPMDILVVAQSRWDELKDLPGLIYREVMMRGRVAYESPAQNETTRVAPGVDGPREE